MKNYYKILGVRKSAKREDILKAYSKLLKQFREKKDKTLVNRNNIILITEAFNVITDSSERVKYDREYKNYLENKDEIDRNEKNERENRRREREEKILEEEESKKREEEEAKKEEEEAKKEEEEEKKKKEEESKKREEEEEKKKKEEESKKREEEEEKKEEEAKIKKEEEAKKKKEEPNKKETEKKKESKKNQKNPLNYFEDVLIKSKEFVKSSNFIFFITGILITLLIVILVTKCGDDDIPKQPVFEEITSQDDIIRDNNSTDSNDQGSESDEVVEWDDIIDDEEDSEDEVENIRNNPVRGTVLRKDCDGTTQVERIANGRGGFNLRKTENSTECGYVRLPSRGTLFKSRHCIGTELVNTFHDGKGGFYNIILDEKSTECGYQEPDSERETVINRVISVKVYDKRKRFLKDRDNVVVYVLKDNNPSSKFNGGRFPYTTREQKIDLSKFPGAKFIYVEGGTRSKKCEEIKPIANKSEITFDCQEF